MIIVASKVVSFHKVCLIYVAMFVGLTALHCEETLMVHSGLFFCYTRVQIIGDSLECVL